MIIYGQQFPAKCICGGQPRAEIFLGSNRWWVKCPDCKVHGDGPTEESVIATWNEIMRKIRWQNSTVKGCCKNPENLKDFPIPVFDREVKVCVKCGCRHFRVLAEPGRLGAVFGALCLVVALLFATSSHAAVGDVVADCQSIAASATLDVQPGAGVEWVIHNIWFEYNVEIQRYDGTDTAAVVQLIGPNYQNFTPAVHVNNTNRIRLKNLHGSTAKVICYDGVITK